jgi:nitrate/nitrite transporter NarK
MVVLGYSVISIAAGLFVWVVIPDPGEVTPMRRNPFANMLLVLGRPIIWAQAAIIICAYCGYKSVDYYALYAVEVLGKDEVEGAQLASYGAYVRPVAALAAGLIADRLGVKRSIGVVFLIMAIASAVLSVVTPDTALVSVIYLNFGISLFAIFALRGIYFALLQETRTPRHITGAAVGMISLVGYTPEIFFAPIAGRILDASPGVGGFLDLFTLLAAISAAGVLCVVWLMFLQRNKNSSEPVS